MNFDDYQVRVKGTRTYPEHGTGSHNAISYCTLGLCGEAGEVSNKVKKLLRDEDTIAMRIKIMDELGDTLWYVASLADEMGVSLSTVANDNIKKLSIRKSKGMIKGEGDDR